MMRLSKKINLVLLVTFILFAILGGILNEWYVDIQTSKKTDQVTQSLLVTTKLDTNEIITNLLLKQNEGISLYLDLVKKREGLGEITVISENQFYLDKGKAKCLEAYGADNQCIIKQGSIYTLYAKMIYGNSNFGYLKKVYRIEPEKVFTVNQLFKIALILIPFIIAIFIVTSMALNRVIVKPLQSICNEIQPLKNGVFDLHMPTFNTLELRNLTDSIFAVSHDLKRYQEEKTHNANLIAIGQSTAMVAHDVRRPMASMKAILKILPEI